MTHFTPTRRKWLLGLAGLGALAGCSRQNVVVTTPRKDDPAEPPAGEKIFSYAIELQRPDGPRMVREDFAFHSGDGFRLKLKPGFNAHVYVLNRGGREDRYNLLFPSEHVSVGNPLRAGSETAIPDDRMVWMRLDKVAGEEMFVLVASMVPLPELEDETKLDRDAVEQTLAAIKRQYQPQSSRRFVDNDWVKILAADGGKDIAIVLQLPIRHT